MLGSGLFPLILKELSKIIADGILNFYYYFFEKIRFDISYELSARQTIYMKSQAV